MTTGPESTEERLQEGLARRTQEDFFGLTQTSATREFVVVGVPWDATSTCQRGAVGGPKAIRKATSSRLYNHFTEQGMDLADVWRVCDHGDLEETGDISELERNLVATVALHNHKNPSALFLGGDHFVTYPCFSLMAKKHERPLSLLYFDAHPDLYEAYEGSAYSHATVVSRILDNQSYSLGTVCYVGTRASTREQNQRISEFGLTTLTTQDVYRKGCDAIASSIKCKLSNQPVYLSIDLDCLDPAFAPGVGNPQPGGLTVRQLLDILHGITGLEVVAADVVEYCPQVDSHPRTTAFTSAILIKEIMGVVAGSRAFRDNGQRINTAT